MGKPLWLGMFLLTLVQFHGYVCNGCLDQERMALLELKVSIYPPISIKSTINSKEGLPFLDLNMDCSQFLMEMEDIKLNFPLTERKNQN